MPALPSTGGPTRQPPARPDVADRRRAAIRFRTALATGDYYALMGPGLRRALRGAAADPSLMPEIGALRLALTYLLNEETDPSRLAAGVARLSSVAWQLQTAHLRAAADEGSEFRNALLQELEAYERELAAQS